MWIVNVEGDKRTPRRWLRPGKTYVVGRDVGCDITVSGKTVSRKHLTLKVELVNKAPHDASIGPEGTPKAKLLLHTLFARHETTVKYNASEAEHLDQDQNSTFDEDQYTGESGFQLILGSPQACAVLTISVVKVSITYSAMVLGTPDGSKSMLYDLIELGIIVSADFRSDTTHFVTSKSTDKLTSASVRTMTALARGIHVVSQGFLDAMLQSRRTMEFDFDAGFPDPLDFLPSTQYFVRKERSECLTNKLFVFSEASQLNSLGHLIEAAGGRKEFLSVGKNATETAAFDPSLVSDTDIVRYITSIQKQNDKLLVLLVKYPVSADDPQPRDAKRLSVLNKASKTLGYHLIDPVDIAEAIITADGSNVYKKRVEFTASASISEQNTTDSRYKSKSIPTERSALSPRPITAISNNDRKQNLENKPRRMNVIDMFSQPMLPKKEAAIANNETSSVTPESTASSQIRPISIMDLFSASQASNTFPSQTPEISHVAKSDLPQVSNATLSQKNAEASNITKTAALVQANIRPIKDRSTVVIFDEEEFITSSEERGAEPLQSGNEDPGIVERLPVENMQGLAVIEAAFPVYRNSIRGAGLTSVGNDSNRISERWRHMKNFKGFRRKGTNSNATTEKSAKVVFTAVDRDFGQGQRELQEINAMFNGEKRREVSSMGYIPLRGLAGAGSKSDSLIQIDDGEVEDAFNNILSDSNNEGTASITNETFKQERSSEENQGGYEGDENGEDEDEDDYDRPRFKFST